MLFLCSVLAQESYDFGVASVRGKIKRRTTNMLERIHEEIGHGSGVAGLFANEALLLRLVNAVMMKLGEQWEMGRRYLSMGLDNDRSETSSNQIYRKKVA